MVFPPANASHLIFFCFVVVALLLRSTPVDAIKRKENSHAPVPVTPESSTYITIVDIASYEYAYEYVSIINVIINGIRVCTNASPHHRTPSYFGMIPIFQRFRILFNSWRNGCFVYANSVRLRLLWAMGNSAKIVIHREATRFPLRAEWPTVTDQIGRCAIAGNKNYLKFKSDTGWICIEQKKMGRFHRVVYCHGLIAPVAVFYPLYSL